MIFPPLDLFVNEPLTIGSHVHCLFWYISFKPVYQAKFVSKLIFVATGSSGK